MDKTEWIICPVCQSNTRVKNFFDFDINLQLTQLTKNTMAFFNAIMVQ